jgi:hypothetical protein
MKMIYISILKNKCYHEEHFGVVYKIFILDSIIIAISSIMFCSIYFI